MCVAFVYVLLVHCSCGSLQKMRGQVSVVSSLSVSTATVFGTEGIVFCIFSFRRYRFTHTQHWSPCNFNTFRLFSNEKRTEEHTNRFSLIEKKLFFFVVLFRTFCMLLFAIVMIQIENNFCFIKNFIFCIFRIKIDCEHCA